MSVTDRLHICNPTNVQLSILFPKRGTKDRSFTTSRKCTLEEKECSRLVWHNPHRTVNKYIVSATWDLLRLPSIDVNIA